MNKKTVVLRLSRLSIANKIAKGRSIVTSMTGNPNFTNPPIPLATLTADINALETAELAAMSGGVTATAIMHSKELQVDLALNALKNFAETVANNNPATAEAIILGAGMEVKAVGIHNAHGFEVLSSGNPGEIKVSAAFVKRATFVFQMCTDTSSESNWQNIGMSTKAKFVKTGLTSGTRYYFRTSYVDKNGQSPWSNVLNIIAP